LSDQVWISNALSKNGRHYHVIFYLLPVLPIGVIGFVWYILVGEEYNLFVLGFVVFVSAVLLHQEVEMIRFIKVASQTSKKIVCSGDDVISIHLFSGKVITLKNFTIENKVPESLTNNIYHRLFPVDKNSATITCDGKEYYLTGTIEGYELVCDKLEKSSISKEDGR